MEESKSSGRRQAWLCDTCCVTLEKLRPSLGHVGTRVKWYPSPRYTGCWAVYSMCSWEKNTFKVSLQTIYELLLSFIVHTLILLWHQKATHRQARGFRVGDVPVLTVPKQSKEFGWVGRFVPGEQQCRVQSADPTKFRSLIQPVSTVALDKCLCASVSSTVKQL